MRWRPGSSSPSTTATPPRGLIQGARRGELPFRVYGDRQDHIPRPNDPYAAPGTQDMTADVNFTDLARGRDSRPDCSVLHFGPERDLVGDSCRAARRGRRRRSLAEFLGNPVFKLLVLGTRPSDVFTGPLLSPLPLRAREQDIPKARRGGSRPSAQRLDPLIPEPG